MPRIGKYEPFGAFLASQSSAVLRMSFRDIERILGAELPRSKRHRAWWSNNAGNNVMTRQWLAAGYVTAQVDIVVEHVVFRRVGEGLAVRGREIGARMEVGYDVPRRDPLFGCMAGTLVLSDAVDLTVPADPDWGLATENG